MYNRALSAAEVKQLYNAGAAKAASANTTAVSNGLVGYWPLDGSVTNWATGKTQDVSGNGNTGQIIGMSTTTSLIAGKIGQALKFTGSGSAANLGDVLNFSSFPVAVSAWVKIDSLPPIFSAVFSSEALPPGAAGKPMNLAGAIFGILSDGTVMLEFADNTGCGESFTRRKISSAAITAGKWYYIEAVARGASDVGIYINGADAGGAYSGSGSGAITSTNRSAQIGDDNSCGDAESFPFPGLIDDVRVYNRNLTAAEVKQLYKSGTANAGHSNSDPQNGLNRGLVGYWTFDGSATNWATGKTQDISGRGNTGQLRSMSTSTSPVPGKIGQALMHNGLDKSCKCRWSRYGDGPV